VSRDGSRSDSARGNEATNSLVPITATTSAGVTTQPKRRSIHQAAASRYAALPMVAGYPVAPAAASTSALTTIPGIGSSGVPTDTSIMPPGTALATCLSASRRSCG